MALIRIPGPARRYIETTTDETLSRRKALEKLERPLPKTPRGQPPKTGYGQFIAGLAERAGRGRNDLRRDATVKQTWKTLRQPGRSETKRDALEKLSERFGIDNYKTLLEAYRKHKYAMETTNVA